MKSHKPGILILGGGYAGLVAAARIARRSSPAAVTLIDARPEFTQRIRLHELLAGAAPATLEYAPRLARRGVRFVQGHVESLDLARQRVTARSPAGGGFTLGYDHLILALGSATAAGVPGVAEHAVRLNGPDEVRQAGRRLRELTAGNGRVLVAGSGLTGIETATELAERYPALRITLAARGRLDDDSSTAGTRHLRERFRQLGVEVLEGTAVEALEPGLAWTSGGALPFDLCVWCAGFEAPALAREAGLAVDRSGRALVDRALRVAGHTNVFAAGDAAAASAGWGPVRMERAVFLLRESFDFSYREIAEVLGKSEENCRQIERRARGHLSRDGGREGRARPADPEEHDRLLARFLQTTREGDIQGFLELLASDAILYSDGGGKALAALNPIRGADKIARFLEGLVRKFPGPLELKPARVNGRTGFLTFSEDRLLNVVTVHVEEGRIRTIYIVVNPDKLPRNLV